MARRMCWNIYLQADGCSSASLAAACLHCEMIHDNQADPRISSCKKKTCELVWVNELVVFLLKIQWIKLLWQLSAEWIYASSSANLWSCNRQHLTKRMFSIVSFNIFSKVWTIRWVFFLFLFFLKKSGEPKKCCITSDRKARHKSAPQRICLPASGPSC